MIFASSAYLHIPLCGSLHLLLSLPQVCVLACYPQRRAEPNLEHGQPIWGNAAWGMGMETGKFAKEKVGRPHEGVFLPESCLQATGAQHPHAQNCLCSDRRKGRPSSTSQSPCESSGSLQIQAGLHAVVSKKPEGTAQLRHEALSLALCKAGYHGNGRMGYGPGRSAARLKD